MKEPYPVQVGWGWSTSMFAFISILIRYFTRPKTNPFSRWAKWSHMFLMFKMSDGTIWIHEALGNQGWCEKNSLKLCAWHDRHPWLHPFETIWLPIGEIDVQKIYTESKSWIGTKSYDFRQVVAFGMSESILFRKRQLFVVSRNDEVFCSEGATECVGKFCPEWDLRIYKELPYCLVTPQGAYDEYRKRIADVQRDIPTGFVPCGDT